jgi:hypothetical protein
LTQEHLINSTNDSLVSKINKTYYSYPNEQHEGRLFFKIMMDTLQNNSEESAEYLISMVKSLKLTNFDGEKLRRLSVNLWCSKLARKFKDLYRERSLTI